MKNRTTIERVSERELVASRNFAAPPAAVYEAWTRPELFMRWWAPKSMGVPLLSCDMDVRIGGGYRIAFGRDAESAMPFFGTYIDVVPKERLVWTNEESGDAPVTTVTFTPSATGTLLHLHERHPAPEALDEAFAGMEACTPEQFDQLDALLLSESANAR